MILPVWVTSSGGVLSRRALDPRTMTVASITRETSLSATEVIARLGTNLTDLRRYIPEDFAGYATGYYDFGPYTVYVFNSTSRSFEDASLSSADAIVLVETSQARLVRLRESIAWEDHRGWVENYSDAFNTTTRLFNFLLRAAKLTIRLIDLSDLEAYQALGTSQVAVTKHGTDTIVVEKVLVDGETRYLVSRVEKGYGAVWRIRSSSGVITAEVYVWTSSQEEVLSGIERSKLITERYGAARSGIKAGQIGLIAVTQGREAVIAFRDGDVIRGTIYTLSTGTSVLSVAKSDLPLYDLGVRSKLGALEVGTVAALAASVLLTGYNIYQGASTDDPILKRSHYESASAVAIDSAIAFLVPGYGAAAQFGWLGENLLMSFIMPNALASKITSSPGTTITFVIEYIFTSNIPSETAKDALGGALNAAVQMAKEESESGYSVAVIPPQ